MYHHQSEVTAQTAACIMISIPDREYLQRGDMLRETTFEEIQRFYFPFLIVQEYRRTKIILKYLKANEPFLFKKKTTNANLR